jgi:hypothetical protein
MTSIRERKVFTEPVPTEGRAFKVLNDSVGAMRGSRQLTSIDLTGVESPQYGNVRLPSMTSMKAPMCFRVSGLPETR